MAKGTKKKKEPRVIPGTSDYVVRENAARKQLGVAGLAARNKQVPTAARAALREMTGIDISRKGVSVDPIGLAMAVSPFKLLKASKALRAAGQVGKAAAVEARLGARSSGKYISKSVDFYKRSYYDSWPKKSLEEGIPPFEFPGSLPSNAGAQRRLVGAINNRVKSESVFPRASTGTLRSISSLNPETARSAAKSFGQAASGERGLARSLRNVPGERNRSMNLFKDSLANQRAGKAISKYKTPKVGR